MKRPLIGEKDFQPSIGQGEQTQGGVIGGLQKKVVSCVCFLEGEGREWMWEILSSYVWKSVVHGKKMCANKNHEGKLCVISSCNRVHGRISMTKPLDF